MHDEDRSVIASRRKSNGAVSRFCRSRSRYSSVAAE